MVVQRDAAQCFEKYQSTVFIGENDYFLPPILLVSGRAEHIALEEGEKIEVPHPEPYKDGLIRIFPKKKW